PSFLHQNALALPERGLTYRRERTLPRETPWSECMSAQASYTQRFFALQLTLAWRIAALSEQPIEKVVLGHTALYRLLGLDWSFDDAHPVWQTYEKVLQGDTPDAAQTHAFYLARYDQIPRAPEGPRWGCFSYDYDAGAGAIYLHFGNHDAPEPGALSSQRQATRLSELTAMFHHIQEAHPDAQTVRGESWLYSREGYRRLFPAVYTASAREVTPNLQARSCWGQFQRSDWHVNEEAGGVFLARGDCLHNRRRS